MGCEGWKFNLPWILKGKDREWVWTPEVGYNSLEEGTPAFPLCTPMLGDGREPILSSFSFLFLWPEMSPFDVIALLKHAF